MVKVNINSKIDWRIGKVKMTRCPKYYGKQWRPKQGKPGWQKQKKEEKKKEKERSKKKEKRKMKKIKIKNQKEKE